MKKTLEDWLVQYGESHQHPKNKAIHKVCVPVIYWAVFAFLWVLPVPDVLAQWHFRWVWLALAVVVLFYGQFGLRSGLGMTFYTMVNIALIWIWAEFIPISLTLGATVLFILAWIGQFWGHHIEGKKPSFFEDIQFLLIGPAWVLNAYIKGKR